ncbi:MMPL family protein [Mycobacterium xenopi 3993]|nr:MMPL family protein [Mycobacterium xenopi 3993]
MVAFDGRRERAGATDRVGREKPCGDCVAERCPSEIAARRIGAKFHESDSDSIAMVVLESDKKLGAEAHRYYDGLVKKLQADPKHVQHVQNVWGDPLTAAGVESRDGKAAYVFLNLAGDQGSTLGNESVKAVREIVADSAPPKGLKVYVTGPAR